MSMSDDPKTAAESPMARALRMKKAALAAKPKPPGGKSQARASAAMPMGASKPAMRK